MRLPGILIAATLSFSLMVAAVDFDIEGIVCTEVPPTAEPVHKSAWWDIPQKQQNGVTWTKEFSLTKDSLIERKDLYDQFPFTGLQFYTKVVFEKAHPKYGYWHQISKDPYHSNQDLDGNFVITWYSKDNISKRRSFYLSHHDTCFFKNITPEEISKYDMVQVYQY